MRLWRKLRVLLLFWLYVSSILCGTLIDSATGAAAPPNIDEKPPFAAPASNPTQADGPVIDSKALTPGLAPPDFFGIVGRDPWYEWNTDPANFPNQPNLAFLENMAREIRLMGARWVRIEFRADQRPGYRGGYLDYTKYDAFIKDIAPRYGLKILALIGADAINSKNPGDGDLNYTNINLPPDRPDGSNVYTRFFAVRTREIMNWYGDKIAAYELLNEQNLWAGFTASPNSVGAMMVYTYTLAKHDQPHAKILIGGIIHTPSLPVNSVEYLGQIYASQPIQDFFKNGTHYDYNPFPFDGVAWHPYFPTAGESVKSIRDAITKMRSWGDSGNKLWVTETSVSGRPNPVGTCGVSSDELNQANYLLELYGSIIFNNLADVASIFWFKYEDFYDQSGYQPWGLVRLEADSQNHYLPGGRVNYYKQAYRVYQYLAGPPLPVDRVPQPAGNPADTYYFSETGHTLSGPFLRYWASNGGLPLFGFPITEPFDEANPDDGKVYKVQYFERERFEYHPETPNPAYQVQLGLLGKNMLSRGCRSYPRALPPAPGSEDPSRAYFSQTGHYLGGSFKRYWEQNGGLAIFGYPVTEEFSEQGSDGKNYIVQWFERARFEYHPENAGTKFEVLLGLLGYQWLRIRAWTR